MNEAVIDASALLALLNSEPGSDIVTEYLQEGIISAVNWSEVVAKLNEAGLPDHVIAQLLRSLGLGIVPFDEEQAFQAGLLRLSTKKLGLSSGDRACLSLAKMRGIPAITADKIWQNLTCDIAVIVIR